MTYLTVPRTGMVDRLRSSIPIFMDDVSAEPRLVDGAIKLIPGIEYPAHIKRAATYGNMNSS